jgi:hypothetical protein
MRGPAVKENNEKHEVPTSKFLETGKLKKLVY